MFIHGSHFSYTTAINVGPVKKKLKKTEDTRHYFDKPCKVVI